MTTRREFLIKSGQAVALTSLAPLLSCTTQQNSNNSEYKLPELAYSYQDLEPFIDKETMEIHYSKHHQGYTTKLNKALSEHKNLQNKPIEDLLKNLNDIPESIRESVRNNGGGYYNHLLFWDSMAPNKTNETPMPSGKLSAQLKKISHLSIISKETFSKKTTSVFGSGWGWLVTTNGKLEIMTTENQDNPISYGKVPIVGLDVWEHAYYLKYQNMRADYVKGWWNIVNWTNVSARFEKVM